MYPSGPSKKVPRAASPQVCLSQPGDRISALDFNVGKPATAGRAHPRANKMQAASGCRVGGGLAGLSFKAPVCVGGRVGGRFCPAWWPRTNPLGTVGDLSRRPWPETRPSPPAHPKWPTGGQRALLAWSGLASARSWAPRVNQSRQCGSSLIKVQGFNRSFKKKKNKTHPNDSHPWPSHLARCPQCVAARGRHRRGRAGPRFLPIPGGRPPPNETDILSCI